MPTRPRRALQPGKSYFRSRSVFAVCWNRKWLTVRLNLRFESFDLLWWQHLRIKRKPIVNGMFNRNVPAFALILKCGDSPPEESFWRYGFYDPRSATSIRQPTSIADAEKLQVARLKLRIRTHLRVEQVDTPETHFLRRAAYRSKCFKAGSDTLHLRRRSTFTVTLRPLTVRPQQTLWVPCSERNGGQIGGQPVQSQPETAEPRQRKKLDSFELFAAKPTPGLEPGTYCLRNNCSTN